MSALTFGETILAMFQLAILAALWGIYRELEKLAEKKAEEE